MKILGIRGTELINSDSNYTVPKYDEWNSADPDGIQSSAGLDLSTKVGIVIGIICSIMVCGGLIYIVFVQAKKIIKRSKEKGRGVKKEDEWIGLQ